MKFNIPLSQPKADQLLAALDLPERAQVVDLGCGRGEFLLDVVRAHAAHGLGLDMDTAAIDYARRLASYANNEAQFQQVDLQKETLPASAFDLAICLGSTHAFASGEAAYPHALQAMQATGRPGGLLLLGEGFWERTPDPDYLAFLGEPVGIYHDHTENIKLGESLGLVPLYAVVSNLDEWDHVEWSHQAEIESEAAANPENTELAAQLDRRRAWMEAYFRWGRGTMGFGYYLFQKP